MFNSYNFILHFMLVNKKNFNVEIKYKSNDTFTININCTTALSTQVESKRACAVYLDLLNIKAMFSTSDILTRVFLLITLPRSSSTVLSSSLKFANIP